MQGLDLTGQLPTAAVVILWIARELYSRWRTARTADASVQVREIEAEQEDKDRLWERIEALEKGRELDRIEFTAEIRALTERIAALENEKLELAKQLAMKEARLALLDRDYHEAGEYIRSLEDKMAHCKNCAPLVMGARA